MKLFSLLSLALFCVDTATAAPVSSDGSLGFRPVGSKPAAVMSTIGRREAAPVKAAIMTPIERREATEMKAAIMTPIQRRAEAKKAAIMTPIQPRALPKIKLPKTDAEKVADAKKVLTSGGKGAADTAADAAKKAARDARKAEKKASKGKKEKKVDETKKDLTEDDKKGVQEELEASKKQKQKEKDEEKTNDDVEIKSVTRKEYTAFWKEFSTNTRLAAGSCYRGGDNSGYVTASCIQNAFETCMKAENQKYLFWSSGGSDAFMAHAVKRYMELSGSIKIADAVKLASCKKNIAPMNRRGMKEKFHTWIEKKRTTELIAKTKNPKAKARVTAAQRLKGNFIADLNYRYYWPIMSAAYAAAASGEVYYLRPDRVSGEAYDFPNSHWVDYELPELKKNKKVTKLTEATMKQVRIGENEAYGGQFANMQPTKETVRIENGRVQEVRES